MQADRYVLCILTCLSGWEVFFIASLTSSPQETRVTVCNDGAMVRNLCVVITVSTSFIELVTPHKELVILLLAGNSVAARR